MLTAQDIDREFTEAVAYRLPRNRAMYDKRATIQGTTLLYDEMLPDHVFMAITSLVPAQRHHGMTDTQVREFPERA